MARDYNPTPEMAAQLSIVESFSAYRDLAAKIYAEDGKTEQYQTGWGRFDEYMGGGFGSANRGELVTLIADTGVGKSTFASNIAIATTANSHERLHYMSLENPPEDAYNTMCHILNLPTLGDNEKYFTAPSKDLLFEGAAWSADDLIAHMTYVVKSRGTKLFVLDHLNFMFENEEQVKNELARTRAVMKRLSQWCMSNRATVFVISHINKPAGKQKKNELLTLSRIYGSQAIAGASTKILALNEFLDEGVRYIDVQMLKSRYTNWDRNALCRFNVDSYKWEWEGLLYR